MGLKEWLLKQSPIRAMVVALPGGTEARLAVERISLRRGWGLASSPAEANILVVAGPVDDSVRPYLERVWDVVPLPRARADVPLASHAEAALDAAAAAVRDPSRQRSPAGHADHHEQQRENSPQHGGHEQHEGHEGHGGHDMHGMEMPGGIPMAERADDRDGLKLDQVGVPLGPALPDWPAGLLVRATLQGDVVQEATVDVAELAEAGADAWWAQPWRRRAAGEPVSAGEAARHLAARRMDTCARILALTGPPDAFLGARRLRDEVLAGQSSGTLSAPFETWSKRLRRHPVLRWLLHDVGTVPDLPSTPWLLAGDAFDRLQRSIELATRAMPYVDQSGPLSGSLPDWLEPDRAADVQWTVDVLPRLLEGCEFAVARLIVASLDPDVELLPRHEVLHG